MIKLKTPAFLALSQDSQTPQKVNRAMVMFHTPSKGIVQTWCILEKETTPAVIEADEIIEPAKYAEVCTAFHKEYKLDYFSGKKANILAVATAETQAVIAALNPNVEFISE